MTEPADPEDILGLTDADLAEVEVDEADEHSRPIPLEAEPADVQEQREAVDEDDDARRDE